MCKVVCLFSLSLEFGFLNNWMQSHSTYRNFPSRIFAKDTVLLSFDS